MIAVPCIILAEASSGSRQRSVIVVRCLVNPLAVEAAGCIVGVRTESAIVTEGRIFTVIKSVITNVCCPVLLASEPYKMQRSDDELTERERTPRVMPCFISARSDEIESVLISTVEVC